MLNGWRRDFTHGARSLLGVTPVSGRLPSEADGEGEVVLISHRLWPDWFGRDPGVVGQPIEVSGVVARIGIGDGLVAAVLAARWLDTLLFEVESLDPAVFATVAAMMLSVAAAASYLPARRAFTVNPLEAMRAE